MFVTTFGAPLLIGVLWDDATSVFVWACLVKCLLGVWHCCRHLWLSYLVLIFLDQYGTALS